MQDAARITTAVLLAAGVGARLLPLTQSLPKCLAPVDGVPMLWRLLHTLRMQGICRLIIVAGHRWEQVRDYAAELASGIDVELILNPDYATSNNIVSLWLARNRICEPFLLVESDLVFDSAMLDPLLVPDRLAVSLPLPWMNGTTVSLDADSRVERFYLQGHPHAPQQYKTVNICSLSLPSWHTVAARMAAFIVAGRKSEFYEAVFAELVHEGGLTFQGVRCDPSSWYEVDTLADLQIASRLCAEQAALAMPAARWVG